MACQTGLGCASSTAQPESTTAVVVCLVASPKKIHRNMGKAQRCATGETDWQSPGAIAFIVLTHSRQVVPEGEPSQSRHDLPRKATTRKCAPSKDRSSRVSSVTGRPPRAFDSSAVLGESTPRVIVTWYISMPMRGPLKSANNAVRKNAEAVSTRSRPVESTGRGGRRQ